METTQEPTFDQDILTIVAQLPPPIRALFASGKIETVAKNLILKNKLSAEQGVIVERELILLLLGINDPVEVGQTLATEANLGQEIIDGIMQDIDTQIFVPLQEEMKKPIESVKPAEPVRPVMKFVPPQPSFAKGSGVAQPENLDFRSPTPANPSLPKRPDANQMSGVSWIKNTPPPRPAQVIAQMPNYSPRPAPVVKEIPKPIIGEKLLEDREEPHIEFKKPSVLPPPNLPGAMPPVPQVNKPVAPHIPLELRPFAVASRVTPTAPIQQPPAKSIPAVAPVSKIPPASSRPYSTDPYHEPIDEK